MGLFDFLKKLAGVAPEETSSEQSKPVEEAKEEPAAAPAEEAVEQTVETPAEEPAAQPEEAPAEEPAEQPEETPAEGPAEQPEEAPAEEPAEQPEEAPTEETEEQPEQTPAEPEEPAEEAPAEPEEAAEETPAEPEEAAEETSAEPEEAAEEAPAVQEDTDEFDTGRLEKLIMEKRKEKKKKKKEDKAAKKLKKAELSVRDEQEKADERSLYTWTRDKKKKNGKPEILEKIPVTAKETVIGEGLPKICVPIFAATDEEILMQAEYIRQAGPDLVEWRADRYVDVCDTEKMGALLEKLAEVLGSMPLLLTIRSRREGGDIDLEPADYERILLWAAARPEIDLIDVEGLMPGTDTELLIRDIHGLGKSVISSCHFFDRTPKKQEMERILDKLERTGGDILKLAVMPEKSRDVLKLMDVTAEKNDRTPCPLITMAMGDIGRISRISGRLTGSCVTFATVGQSSAPGQIPLVELRNILNLI